MEMERYCFRFPEATILGATITVGVTPFATYVVSDDFQVIPSCADRDTDGVSILNENRVALPQVSAAIYCLRRLRLDSAPFVETTAHLLSSCYQDSLIWSSGVYELNGEVYIDVLLLEEAQP